MGSPRRRLATGRWQAATAVLALSAFTRHASADNFVRAYYDPSTDQLVVTMHYRGTNPDHRFSLQWGACQPAGDAGVAEVSAVVLDSQASDAARTPFNQTTRFDLGAAPCRPAKLTLRTAPRFEYMIQIPKAP
jgi:hypothetical protein